MKKLFCTILALGVALTAPAQFKGTNGVAFTYSSGFQAADVFIAGRPGVTNYNVAASNLLAQAAAVSKPIAFAQQISGPVFAPTELNITNAPPGIGFYDSFAGGYGSFSFSAALAGIFNFGTHYIAAASFIGGGGSISNLSASSLASGTVPTARLGTGTADATTVLRGDQTWAALDDDLLDLADGSLTGSKVGSGIPAGNITTGTVPTAQLGSGTASSSTFLRGDSTWATISGGTDYSPTIPFQNFIYATNITAGSYDLIGINISSGNVFVQWLGDILTLHADAGGVRISGTTTNTGALRVEGDLNVDGSADIPTINSETATVTNLVLVNPFDMNLGTNVSANNLVQYTNGPNPVLVDMSKRAGFVSTNASFTITGLSLPNTTNSWETSVLYTNTSGSLKTATLPAGWIGTSTTEYLTNQSVLTVWFYPGAGTNAIWRPLK